MAVKESSTPVPNPEHTEQAFDWGDIQLFMLVARCGSLRSASKHANKSVNSLRRRLKNLEHRLNCRLLVPDASGTQVTEQGRRLLVAGETMFEASLEVSREFKNAQRHPSQAVTIEVEEALASFWLMRLARKFQQLHPESHLQFQSSSAHLAEPSLHSDVTVCTGIPPRNSLIVTRLGYLHCQPFASRDFVRRNGRPADLSELDNFCLVERTGMSGHRGSWSGVLPAWPAGHIAVTADTDGAQISAVIQGAGIGLLPTFLAETEMRLVPVLDSLRFRQDLYLTYRRGAAEHRQVRLVIDWLKQAFCSRRYLWFSESLFSSLKTPSGELP